MGGGEADAWIWGLPHAVGLRARPCEARLVGSSHICLVGHGDSIGFRGSLERLAFEFGLFDIAGLGLDVAVVHRGVAHLCPCSALRPCPGSESDEARRRPEVCHGSAQLGGPEVPTEQVWCGLVSSRPQSERRVRLALSLIHISEPTRLGMISY